jgi:hydrogenase-4 component B
VVIWLGIITMLAGAIMALFQDHSHRILAYSSISQMGYVMLGIGCAVYLGINGAMGYAGALFT